MMDVMWNIQINYGRNNYVISRRTLNPIDPQSELITAVENALLNDAVTVTVNLINHPLLSWSGIRNLRVNARRIRRLDYSFSSSPADDCWEIRLEGSVASIAGTMSPTFHSALEEDGWTVRSGALSD